MTLVYDDTWLREPNLLVPGKKPIGPVQVDWQHPLTRDLYFCYVPTSQHRTLLPNAVQSTLLDVVATKDGLSLANHASAEYESLSIIPPPIYTGVSTLEYTYFCQLDINTFVANWDDIVAYGANVYFASSGSNEILLSSSITSRPLSTTIVTPPGEVRSIAAVYRQNIPNVQEDGYLNGNYVATSSANDASARTRGLFDLFRLGEETGTPNRFKWKVTYFWTRALSSVEMKQVSDDPYQFLEPA